MLRIIFTIGSVIVLLTQSSLTGALCAQDSLRLRGAIFELGPYTGAYAVSDLSTGSTVLTNQQNTFELVIPKAGTADSLDLKVRPAVDGATAALIQRVASDENEFHVIVSHFSVTGALHGYTPRLAPAAAEQVYWGTDIGIAAEFLDLSFTPFDPVLTAQNTRLLDSVSPIPIVDFNGFVKRWYFGIGYGQRLGDRTDSIRRVMRHRTYRIRGGYQLMQTDHVRITAITGLRWMRWRLFNSPGVEEQPLEQYLSSLETDLRFTQWLWEIGIKCGWVFREVPSMPDLHLGFALAYVAPLHAQPTVRSPSSRLEHDAEVGVSPWLIGIHFAFFID